jgi:hypothetical protein
MQSFLGTGFPLLVLRLIVLVFIWSKTPAVIKGHSLLLSNPDLGRALGPGSQSAQRLEFSPQQSCVFLIGTTTKMSCEIKH